MLLIKCVFIMVILLSISSNMSDSCSCFPRHTQEIFCSSFTDIVVKAVILSDKRQFKLNMSPEDERIFGLSYYNSYITKIFKGEKLLRRILAPENQTSSFNPRHQKAILFTSSSSGTCGATLKKGVKYLLSGSVTRGRIEMSICDWIAPFHSLSRQQKFGIKGGYDCNCKLDECPRVKSSCDMPSDKCEWNKRFRKNLTELNCDLEHRMCKSIKGKCLWFEDAYYEPCIMKHVSHALNLTPKFGIKNSPSKELKLQSAV